ncbi:MAG: SRPBCC family protein [Actinomycetota bacterium]
MWLVDLTPSQAFDVLRHLEDYPLWWPEVREVRRLSDDTVEARCRSLLPYDLLFTMRSAREVRHDGILEVIMQGDLDGLSRWTITSNGSGSRLLFEEKVATHKKLLNRLAPIARGAFKLNHTLMMRHGEAGLRAYAAGFRRAHDLRT